MTALLEVQDLVVEFHARHGARHGAVQAVNGVNLEVQPGEVVGVVGESGSGKTTTCLSILRLLPTRARVIAGRVLFDGQDLLQVPGRHLRRIRGREIGFVFQDPLTSLHPSLRIGAQVQEAILAHDRRFGRRAAMLRAIELLDLVGVPNAETRARDHPHQWSGGMRQRAMIAMAIANRPRLLIADEPASALDATSQAQIVDVLRIARQETGAATILVTHDLGLLAQIADRVAVMYAGRVVEFARVDAIFGEPKHPYTVGLLDSLPRLDQIGKRLVPIAGQPPVLLERSAGCDFEPRCWLGAGRRRCQEERPEPVACDSEGHGCACHFVEEVSSSARRQGPP